jgi:hypothetical protein
MTPLFELLQRFESGVPLPKLAELRVIFWHAGVWEGKHTRALKNVCQICQVKKIHFELVLLSGNGEVARCLAMLEKHVVEHTDHFLRYLRTVEIDFTYNNRGLLWSFIDDSRVTSLKYNVVPGLPDQSVLARAVEHILLQFGGYTRENNLHLREVIMECPDEVYSVSHKKPIPSSEGKNRLLDMLTRNGAIWQFYQSALITLIGLWKRRKTTLSILTRDAMGIILGMLWGSRSTKVWHKVEQTQKYKTEQLVGTPRKEK